MNYSTKHVRNIHSMATGMLNMEQVVELLDVDGGAEDELGDCFFPGSDDELGFEEEELEGNQDTKYNITVALLILHLSC